MLSFDSRLHFRAQILETRKTSQHSLCEISLLARPLSRKLKLRGIGSTLWRKISGGSCLFTTTNSWKCVFFRSFKCLQKTASKNVHYFSQGLAVRWSVQWAMEHEMIPVATMLPRSLWELVINAMIMSIPLSEPKFSQQVADKRSQWSCWWPPWSTLHLT